MSFNTKETDAWNEIIQEMLDSSYRQGLRIASTITYCRQFDSTHNLYSTLSRASIDALKENFRDKLENSDWKLVVHLKKVFGIL